MTHGSRPNLLEGYHGLPGSPSPAQTTQGPRRSGMTLNASGCSVIRRRIHSSLPDTATPSSFRS